MVKSSKQRKKQKLIIGGVIGVIALLLVFSALIFITGKTKVAGLNIESGEVQVDTGSGWGKATNGMKLKLKDKIKTGNNGKASLILYESAIISLKPNTEIMISDLSKDLAIIKQSKGTTWNKFTGLSGLRGLEVETPTTVATVRGTEFKVSAKQVIVAEGNVEVKNKLTGAKKFVGQGEKASISEDALLIEQLSQEEWQMVVKELNETIGRLKNLREEAMKAHPAIVKLIKSTYGLTDKNVQEQLDAIDRGDVDEDALIKQSIVQVPALEQVVGITKNIKKQNQLISQITQTVEKTVTPNEE